METMLQVLERRVDPAEDELIYCGRIDDTNPHAPVFVQPGSFVKLSFTGSSYVKAVLVNHRRWNDSYVGVLAGDRQHKIKLEEDETEEVVSLVDGLDKELEQEVTLFKRMDQCHTYTFLGFLLEDGARLLRPRPLPRKKIEFYGDSVTAGEAVEAIACHRLPDPVQSGEYNNAYFSFAWATARKLHAQVQLVAQGGIALADGAGYHQGEEGLLGMEGLYDKVNFFPDEKGEFKSFNFGRYTPQVVVVALGQNDATPEDFMREDAKGERAKNWQKRYKAFVEKLRVLRPQAYIVLTTTILNHHPGWDRAIGRACAELNDPKIVHFLFEETGRGTPGHVRVADSMNMALELAGFIEGLSARVWD